MSRSNNLSERPKWVDETRAFFVETSSAYFVGGSTIPADHRLEAGYRIAEADAKSRVCQTISNKMEAIFQHAEEGTSFGSDRTRYSFLESCQRLTLRGLEPGKRFYEKYVTSLDSGERVSRYRIFVTGSMPERQLRELCIKVADSAGISQDFQKKVDEQWDRIVGTQPLPTASSSTVAETISAKKAE
ncbi:hypothetical protein WDW37_19420 [Bdellovibrionota bacterium FG-1]